MTNRTKMRECGRTYNFLRSKALILAGFGMMIALGVSSLALHTRKAATQELDKNMPTLKGDSAVEYLKGKSNYDSLANAFTSIAADDPRDNPEAMTKLTPNDGVARGFFGSSVAISGNTAIIGAPNLPQGNNGTIPGAAYIFVRNGASWTFQQKLTAPDSPANNGNAFGDTVGISGDTVVVAAPQHNAPEPYSGGAYVFVRNGTTWTLQKRFTNVDTPLVKFGQLGYSVAISGDTVLVTGFGFVQSSPHRDFVHVFVREGTTWTIQTTLITGGDNSFDSRVAISGNTAVIGDPNRSGTRQNAAYIYVRCGTEWTQQQRLTSSGSAFDDFGSRVGISSNTVIIGAPQDQIAQNQTGSAYIFVTNDGTTWTQQARLTGAVHRLSFGQGVAILGDTAIIGAPNGTFQGGTLAGAADVFVRSGTTWTRDATITAPDGQTGDRFGSSVAISNDVIFAGAPNDDLSVGSTWATDRTTAEPPPTASPCEDDIEVNITTDQPDIDLDDDLCDVDMGQSGNQCSLRAAIQTANAKDGPDEIIFNITGVGTHTISPLTQLPSITEKVSIDAATQPGYSGTPVVELRGDGVQGGLGFFNAESGDSLVSGLAINRFAAAVAIGSSGNRIERCYIGLGANGAAGGGTAVQLIGIDLRTAAASNNTIGGAGVLGNVISDNGVGVAISQGAPGNKVLGNRIGTNAAGTAAIPNVVGAFIDASSGNRIGDAVSGTGNLISGSTGVGIAVNTGSTNNLILGNLIGTNAAGTEAIANGNGLTIDTGSSNNRVGSDTGLFGNVISGSTFTAVTLKAGSSNNVVAGNKIGTNAAGTAAIPNKFGVALDGANSNIIGDLVASAKGNLISGNTDMGVVLQGSSANNRVSFNSIGTRSNGTEVLPNGEAGILLTGGVRDNTIEANVVGGHDTVNSGSGIAMSASVGPANLVMDNFVGVARNGTTPLPNWFGIGIAGDGQIIGSATRRNLIGKNLKAGIVLAPATGNPVVENNIIEGNLVGTNGTADLGNEEFGIWVDGGCADNTIRSNYVSGNVFAGIALTDNTRSNDVLDNRIGVNVGSTLAILNGIGIWVRQSSDNTIAQNLVAGNDIGMLFGTNIGVGETAAAVERFRSGSSSAVSGGAFTSGNRVHTNIIGVGPSGPISNRIGIAVGENARNNLIGTAEGANLISGNTNPGLSADLQGTNPNTTGMVLVRASRNTIGGNTDALANYIVANTREGILMSDGTGENIFLKNYVGKLPPGFGSRSKGGAPASPTGAYGNGSHGILIENGARGNTLGGATIATGMVISDNGGNGIHIASTAGNGNRIGANSISGNTLPGIDLGGNGFTVNDPTDADVGPNNLQNYPTMTFSISGGNLIVNYQVDSAPANSVYGTSGIKVDFYEADSTGQGSTSLGTDQYLATDYTNGTPGTRQKNLGNAAAIGFVAGDRMTATATDADGNSSEFTPAVIAPGGAPGFEGDVAPRPNGDGNMLSTDITQLRRFVSGLDVPGTTTNELQRADCAPRSTFGDGVLTSSDVVQGRRYVAGLDPSTPSGGPASRSFISESSLTGDLSSFLFTREMRVGQSTNQPNHKVSVPIEMTSNGNETAMSLTIEYDANMLTNPRVSLGKFAPPGSTLTFNLNQPGRIGILIDSNRSMIASAMPVSIVSVTFDVIAKADQETAISLTDGLVARSVSDGYANLLPVTYRDGLVKIAARP